MNESKAVNTCIKFHTTNVARDKSSYIFVLFQTTDRLKMEKLGPMGKQE